MATRATNLLQETGRDVNKSDSGLREVRRLRSTSRAPGKAVRNGRYGHARSSKPGRDVRIEASESAGNQGGSYQANRNERCESRGRLAVRVSGSNREPQTKCLAEAQLAESKQPEGRVEFEAQPSGGAEKETPSSLETPGSTTGEGPSLLEVFGPKTGEEPSSSTIFGRKTREALARHPRMQRRELRTSHTSIL